MERFGAQTLHQGVRFGSAGQGCTRKLLEVQVGLDKKGRPRASETFGAVISLRGSLTGEKKKLSDCTLHSQGLRNLHSGESQP